MKRKDFGEADQQIHAGYACLLRRRDLEHFERRERRRRDNELYADRPLTDREIADGLYTLAIIISSVVILGGIIVGSFL